MTDDKIEIIKANENNLKDISLSIPKNKLVVFAGVSGSGKSSLVFDTIATESSREWQNSYSLYLRNKMPHYQRPDVESIKNLTPAIVVKQQASSGSSRSTVGTIVDVAPLLRLLYSRVGQPSAGGSMSYSPNHPAGMCPTCTGLGKIQELDEDSLFDVNKSINEGAILFEPFSSGWQSYLYSTNPQLDPNKKLKDFSEKEWQILKYGDNQEVKIEIRSNKTGRVDRVDYEGVIPRFKRLYLKRDISKLSKKSRTQVLSHVTTVPCSACAGTGLNPRALASKINGLNIVDMTALSVDELLPYLDKIDDPRAKSLSRQIANTIQHMIDIGVGYLSLDRKTNTLSGGEMQRLKIVRNLGSSLNNVTYILDEPTTGLHPADIDKIGKMLLNLRDAHNNVLVVEHSRQIINLADEVVEMGPQAGSAGGQIVYQGDLTGLKKADTLTGHDLVQKIELNKEPRKWSDSFHIRDAHCHNLKHVDVDIPKNVLTAVTGVAGSGKSSLIRYDFIKQHPEAIVIDQKPIGTSIRSTPATYTGVMDEIRKIFGKANNVAPSWFSFNSKGACPICKGRGVIKYDMAFADAVEVICEECQGHRYSQKALSYKYQGKNIEEVMNFTISDAINFFDNQKITNALQKLIDVGLGYLTLGQPTSTLSGGEIQRIKIAAELNKKGNIYVMDEPAAGLHSENIKTLNKLLQKLVNNGNTVIIIEHRLELISKADWIIDIGPEGGSKGGKVCFTGTPQELCHDTNSKTGIYLKRATE
ncbi:ATP-binding cassette domain-containing protein [Lactobacillus ultunensis]|uniref:UvrABC system protein A n=1 Tax=Lactobacillus ultunensis DSM 16047 TaxID=525365 RepID=C2ENC0_9LACO|nr:excinuclease ABC subunit UvrA [Lactobacillus ultunensis]EEJ71924.1 putative excinuclease ABC, A subunit [Lactobacillus ultunensis DSM 16047]KRL82079.1 excinuclease subunit A [Lactobacillus ultunensis DSM 16047]QQP27662.1 excinuclease ABC subunit UvrA [Lactobacillus ultunensis]